MRSVVQFNLTYFDLHSVRFLRLCGDNLPKTNVTVHLTYIVMKEGGLYHVKNLIKIELLELSFLSCGVTF